MAYCGGSSYLAKLTPLCSGECLIRDKRELGAAAVSGGYELLSIYACVACSCTPEAVRARA